MKEITQTWDGQTHKWAAFDYGQVLVQPNFGGGLSVNGPNGQYQTVLTQVTLGDNSRYSFEYNSAFGQVNKIKQEIEPVETSRVKLHEKLISLSTKRGKIHLDSRESVMARRLAHRDAHDPSV